jgi:hypothetical protein
MKRHYLTLVSAAALFASPAFADEHKGWVYNGLTGVGSVSESGLSDNALASNSSIGYRWGSVGFEIGHIFFAKFKDSVDVGGSPVVVDTKVDGWNTGVNFNHDFDEKWSMQGRVGLFAWHNDGHVVAGGSRVSFSDKGKDWFAGASIDYKWRKHSSVGLGYTAFKTSDATIGMWGLHTEYRF